MLLIHIVCVLIFNQSREGSHSKRSWNFNVAKNLLSLCVCVFVYTCLYVNVHTVGGYVGARGGNQTSSCIIFYLIPLRRSSPWTQSLQFLRLASQWLEFTHHFLSKCSMAMPGMGVLGLELRSSHLHRGALIQSRLLGPWYLVFKCYSWSDLAFWVRT